MLDNPVRTAAFVQVVGAALAIGHADAGVVVSHWLQPVSGAWTDGVNWSSAPAFPGSGGGSPEFDAVIDSMGDPYAVDLGASVAIRRLTLDSSTATLHQTGGVLTLEDASVVQSGRLVVGGGGLSGSGSLEVASAMDWLGGAIGLLGSLRVAESGSMGLGGGTKTLSGVLEIDGVAAWSSGGLEFNGPSGRILNRGVFNASSPQFALQAASSGALGGLFENEGVFTKDGSGETRFAAGVRFDNNGHVEVTNGNLSLLGGGLHSGSFEVNSGARLDLAGGHSMLPTASIVGSGTVRVTTGSSLQIDSLNFDGAFVASGSTVDFGGPARVRSLVATQGGRVTFHSAGQAGSIAVGASTVQFLTTLTLDPGAGIVVNSAGLLSIGTGAVEAASLELSSGSVMGSGDLIVRDSMNWTGGLIGGSGVLYLDSGAAATLSGSQRSLGRSWVVQGAAAHVFGETLIRDGSVLEIQGLFSMTSGTISGLLDSRVVNYGALRSVALGSAAIATPLENYGSVAVEGTLSLTGGGQHDGAFEVAEDGVLKFRNAHTLSAATSITGAGDIWIDAAQIVHAGALDIGGLLYVLGASTSQFGGPVNAGQFRLRHGTSSTIAFDNETCFAGESAIEEGTLTGDGEVVFKGTLDWWRASMIDAGRTTIEEGGLLRMSVGPVRTLARTLEIHGSTEWTVGTLLLDGGRIENFGEFRTSAANTLDLGGSAGAGGEFLNYGEFLKEGPGSVRFGSSGGPVSLENFGMVDVRRGALQLLGAASTTNNGTYAITRGATIEVSGGFDNAANATLAFEVGGSKPSVPAGLLTITGNAELAGSLVVTTPKPQFAAWGDRWTILQFASLTGDFDSFDLPETSDETLRWWAEAGAASYEVGVSHIADIDHDDFIGFSDLNLIASNFNTFGAWADGDVDGDGFIGFADLNIVLSLYNTAAPPRSVPAPGAALALALLGVARRRHRVARKA